MLDAATKRRLRQSAHHLKPVVLIGQHGMTDAVINEIDLALNDHELIKVRFRGADRDERKRAIADATARLAAELVNTIGGTAVLYREHPEHGPDHGKNRRKRRSDTVGDAR